VRCSHKERQQFGGDLGSFQISQEKLARMLANIQARPPIPERLALHMSCFVTAAVTMMVACFDRTVVGQTSISLAQVSSDEAFLCAAGDDADGVAAEQAVRGGQDVARHGVKREGVALCCDPDTRRRRR